MEGKRHVLYVEDYKGSVREPLNFEETCEKFQRFTQTVVEKKRRDDIKKLVQHLEQLSDIAPLARLIAAK